MKPIDIFRSGTHTDSRGRQFAFSDVDLQTVASKYDPALHHAPIVVGHPKDDHPAYGWVKSIAFQDGHLVAEPEDIEPQFAELVKAKRYRKISASFYSPDHPNNPVPGNYYLRHVGFLGAAPPAVKGLKPVEFADDDDGIIEFDDASSRQAAWGFEMLTKIVRGFRDFVVAEKGIDVADALMPSWQIDSLAETAVQLRDVADNPQPYATNYSDKKEDDMTKEQEAALKAREEAIARQEADFAEKMKRDETERRKLRQAEDAAFVEQITAAGRLPVGLKPLATALFADLSDGTISFSEDGAEKSIAPRQGLRELLGKLPMPVTTGELSTGDGPDFSDPLHVKDAINVEIEAARARGENLSPADAAMRITKR